MEGSVFVEKGGETGIIERFRTDPSSIGIAPVQRTSPLLAERVPEPTVPSGPPSQPPISDQQGSVLEAVLSEMATAIQNDTTMEPSARRDLLADIETLGIQLSKRTKNQAIITAILDNLSGFSSLAPFARLMFRFLGE
jgi:hypothetical protein